ncbi:hypothetical protein AGMMS50255_6880 [Spirochaetia bacterium]|nr:hypothetical protein AGMMS50255_6880 [Spirochaetia bacterium]
MKQIEGKKDPGQSLEASTLKELWEALSKRLERLERIGVKDMPIDAETAAAITGLKSGTMRKYGKYRHVDTIKYPDRLLFSMKSCIDFANKHYRPAVIEITTDLTNYHRVKRGRPKKHPAESGACRKEYG